MKIEIPYEPGTTVQLLINHEINVNSIKEAKVAGYWWDISKDTILYIHCITNTGIMQVLAEDVFPDKLTVLNHLLKKAQDDKTVLQKLIDSQEVKLIKLTELASAITEAVKSQELEK